ncbi:hypothetical protein EYF80_015764 [Liparis tanakae]|uniref:Uncharacterized protein n=1 Tax=Liparis tanakae TaxID=230148 RepID=A0A4Z2I996_9TELE|nr:hypothetical protein EYF80_015764 [Liparis tanakae]
MDVQQARNAGKLPAADTATQTACSQNVSVRARCEGEDTEMVRHTQTLARYRLREVSYVLAVADDSSKILSLSLEWTAEGKNF